MAIREERDGPEKVLRSTGDPVDEQAYEQSSTSTVRLAEHWQDEDHVASSGYDQVLAAERGRGHGTVIMVDQVSR